jgi:hypothetical protein
MKSFGWIVTSSLGAFLAATSVTWAAPPGERCGEGSAKVFKTCLEGILDVEGEIIDNLDLVIEDLEARNILRAEKGRSLTDKLDLLKNSHGRGQGEHDDTGEDDYEEMLAGAYKKSCVWKDSFVEPASLQDGTCDKDERKENLCEKVCELDAAGTEKKDRKQDRLQDELSDALIELEDANDALKDDLKRRASLDFSLALRGDVCPADYSFLGSTRIPTVVMFPLFSVVKGLDAVRDLGERGCDMTVSGFSFAAVCIVLEGAFHLAKGSYEIMNAINEDVNEAELVATYNCAKETKTAADEAAKGAKDVKDSVTEITSQLEQMKEDIANIKTLLKTPPGQRPGFPALSPTP